MSPIFTLFLPVVTPIPRSYVFLFTNATLNLNFQQLYTQLQNHTGMNILIRAHLSLKYRSKPSLSGFFSSFSSPRRQTCHCCWKQGPPLPPPTRPTYAPTHSPPPNRTCATFPSISTHLPPSRSMCGQSSTFSFPIKYPRRLLHYLPTHSPPRLQRMPL